MATRNITINRFWEALPDVIDAIAQAQFVAIDLEMTGIEPRRAAKLPKPTMAEIYQRARDAAHTFRMLQFGLTCFVYDAEQGKFRADSYSFYVSPMFHGRDSGAQALARFVDRTLVVSYRTLQFLEQNRIRLDDAYTDGIPYLSRTEEAEIRSEFLSPDKQPERHTIDVEGRDNETQAFCALVRDKIRRWEEHPDGTDYLNISNPHGDNLNRFQRRLVYEIMENEFPGKYRAVIRGSEFMQILHKDDDTEAQFRARTAASRQRALRAQRGLRYVIEALAGGDFADDIEGLSDESESQGEAHSGGGGGPSRLKRCEEALKERRPVLVGHNMLMDLCFLYTTFFAPLPDTLEAFRTTVHALFPRIVDTKILVTSGDHDMMPAQSLDELYREALKQEAPVVESRPVLPHARTLHPAAASQHHAGFDSFMTGVLFVKELWKRTQAAGSVPPWDSEACQSVANKLRLGNAGILDLGDAVSPTETQGQAPASGAGREGRAEDGHRLIL